MLGAVTYCRCSTEEESQQDALQQQVIESKMCVQEQGWLLLGEYIEAKSGTTTAKRNEYNRLFEDLQSDKFDIVVIKSQDRLMRNTRDWYLFVDRLVSNGKQLYMYLEGKFYSADDALITGIKAILAEEYSKELSKKINNAHFHRQQSGRTFILPPQTYGLKRNEEGNIVLVEEEAEAIRIMFFLCKTMGCISIAHYLEENNICDRNGVPFKEEAIRRIIRNPIRCGTIVQNKRHFDFQAKRTIKQPEEEWVIHKNVVPAVVSEKEWQEANAAMDKRADDHNLKATHPTGRNPGKYQLSGKIRCGECGSPYYRRYRKRYGDQKLIVEWKCQRYILNGRNHPELRRDGVRTVKVTTERGCDNIHLDEERLFQLLENVFKQYQGHELDYNGLADKMISMLSEVLDQNDSARQIKKLQKELDQCEQRTQKLLNKLLDEVISDIDYKEKRKELEQRIEGLTQQLNHLKDGGDKQFALEQRLQTIRKRLESDTIKKASIAEMIDSIETITVFSTKLHITFKPDRMLRIDTSLLESIENVSQLMDEHLQIEVPFEEDFLFATRTEALNKRILDYMRKNSQITARMIAEKEGVSLTCVNARIRRLRSQGMVFFDGKGGHGKWIIYESEEEK